MSPTSHLWLSYPSSLTVLPLAHPRVRLVQTAELTIRSFENGIVLASFS